MISAFALQGQRIDRTGMLRTAARTGPVASPAQPGAEASATCNIGPAELRRRRRSAIVASLLLVAALAAIAAGALPTWTLPWLGPLVGAVVGTLLQVAMRFCMAFGFAGLVGMGEDPGARQADPSLLRAHRRRAAIMTGAAALAALAWVVVTGTLVGAFR